MDLLRNQNKKRLWSQIGSKVLLIRFLKIIFIMVSWLINGKLYPHRYPPIIAKLFLSRYNKLKQDLIKSALNTQASLTSIEAFCVAEIAD